MSQRGDRGEGHARRPGRSSSFGGHSGGGVGGAGKGRGSSALASPSSQQGSIRGMPPHSRGSQDIRYAERHQFDNRTVLPQRAVKDEAISLGPQGGLAWGMSIRGQPPVSNTELPSVIDHRRIVSGSNGYNSAADWTSSSGREYSSSRIPERTSGRTPASSQSAGPSQRPASQEGRSGSKSYSEDELREKSVSSVPRRGAPPMDYGPRGSSALASPSSQQGSIRGMPPHSRGSQDIRYEGRHQFDNRTVLPQRAVKDEAISLGPQGGLARGMSIRGQPPVSNTELPSVIDHRRIVSGSNGYNSAAVWTSSSGREDSSSRIPDRTSGRTPASSKSAGPSQRPASQEGRSGSKSYSEDELREKSVSSVPRRGAPPMDYGPRGSSALASPSSQQGSIRGMPPHSRGSQDIRYVERHQFDNRTVLPQRAVKDEAISLGPQGGLARGMSIRGQPPVSNTELPSVIDHRRIVSGSNGYNSAAVWTSSSRREDSSSRIPDRTSGRTPASSQSAGPSQRPASQEGRSGSKSYSEDELREKSVSAIWEYYSAKDEKEVALCIEELNAPNFYPSVVSLWVNDSFERKDMERGLLAKLLVSLCSGRHNLLSKQQLSDGLKSVVASLEDTLSDTPRATEYLGRLLAKFVEESILLLQEVGKLIQEGGEEPGYLIQDGIAADILGAVLDSIKLDRGDSFLNEVKSTSRLKLVDFRPQHLKRSKLDAFM